MAKEEFNLRTVNDLLTDLYTDSRGFLLAVQLYATGHFREQTPPSMDDFDTIILQVMRRVHDDYFAAAKALDLLSESSLLTPHMKDLAQDARRQIKRENPGAEAFFVAPDIQICLYVAISTFDRTGDNRALSYAMQRFCDERDYYFRNTTIPATPFMEEIWEFNDFLRRDDQNLFRLYKDTFANHILRDFKNRTGRTWGLSR